MYWPFVYTLGILGFFPLHCVGVCVGIWRAQVNVASIPVLFYTLLRQDCIGPRALMRLVAGEPLCLFGICGDSGTLNSGFDLVSLCFSHWPALRPGDSFFIPFCWLLLNLHLDEGFSVFVF